MHKNELRVNPTSINRAIMVYELKAGTIETHESIGFLKIQFLNWSNIPLKRINYTPIPYVNNNETKFRPVTYYPLYADSPWIGIRNLTK